jgi:NAD(P)-dependent dehydrogenase (short-subunit alcohol dehydrogenase family)
MWVTGRDAMSLKAASDAYQHTINVMNGAQSVGEYTSLGPRDAFEAEYWPQELYKLTLALPEKDMARKVALITGAAGGIGRAIGLKLADEGAHVVITDVNLEGAQAVAQEINTNVGAGRAVAFPMDVASESDVDKVFDETCLFFGGLDILVSNAGVAQVGALHELSLADWQQSLQINATGHFLVSRKAVNLMRRQGLGGNLVFVATKNVTAPGKDFGAYSASKAAEAQLARVLAIENGEHKIRCNIINPDAIFQGSGLWSQEVREQRAQAHGISVAGLESYYQQRNLLKQNILAEDVAEAVLFLASEHSSKITGAMIPVDGGLREAFPR